MEQYFKQMNIYKNITLCDGCVSENQIQVTSVDIKIVSKKIIETMKGISLEGQVLSGKKLILIGTLEVKIFIKTSDRCKQGYWIEREIPFSTFIIIPNDICDQDPICISHQIEDITTLVLTKGKIFTTITILFEYHEDY